MAAAETANTQQRSRTGFAKFINDDHGRVLFFPSGLGSNGYVVDTPDRERTLRAAAEQYATRSRRLTPILAVLLLGLFYWLVGSHPLLAFGMMAGSVPIAQFGEEWLSKAVFARHVTGLERTKALKRQRILLLAALLAGIAAAVWIVATLYAWRLAALPRDGAIRVFYDDISWALILTVVGGLILFCMLLLPTAQFTRPRSLLALLVCGAMCFGGVATIASAFLTPVPRIELAGGALVCHWVVTWDDVSDISLRGSGLIFDRTQAIIALTPGSASDLRTTRAHLRQPLSCAIGGLDVASGEAYQAIRDTWIAQRDRVR